MIVFVDYEHAKASTEKWFPKNQAARTWITYRLEDVSGQPCMLVRYNRLTPDLLSRLDAKAIFISGNGTDPADYDPASLAPLAEIVRDSGLPIFGFCGGFQFIAGALDAPVVPLDVTPEMAEEADLITFPNGLAAEFGYHPVKLLESHRLLDGLGDEPVFRHAHALHVPQPPAGFEVLASTSVCPVQMAVSDQRKIVGTQFHPEYWTDENPAGQRLIANFLQWADL